MLYFPLYPIKMRILEQIISSFRFYIANWALTLKFSIRYLTALSNTAIVVSLYYILCQLLGVDQSFCLCWGLTSQSTIFQSCRDGATASWVINQYFRGVKCLAQGHNTVAVGFEPPTSRSGVRPSTTEPPRSPVYQSHPLLNVKMYKKIIFTLSSRHYIDPMGAKLWIIFHTRKIINIVKFILQFDYTTVYL